MLRKTRDKPHDTCVLLKIKLLIRAKKAFFEPFYPFSAVISSPKGIKKAHIISALL